MPDDDPSEQIELSERDRHAVELFRRAVSQGPRARGPLLVELNATLRPHKLSVVTMAGRGRG